MKKIVLAAAMTSAVFAVPAAAAPGDTASANGTANARIVAPIAITHDSGSALDFGTMTAGTGGTVVVTPAGAGSKTGDVILIAGSTNAADSFTVTGEANRGFAIVVTGGSVTSGTNSMTFTTSLASNSGNLGAGGSTQFSVGGTLTVGSGQAAGSYTGSYGATVTYN
ncbi:DUF4402 domain-containing protein [Qipengyuania gaetbuli]|uniref:DUF4402 domain-containing protein n=1 Tax=Qipengyuania gaetbuli TaxID=266952 RepID=UPI001CD4ED8D|nr:DUF4402 domain-containing protein [Qipengyuania gaetbuli]MCA0909269.1 DUF4402 domain-containing protein [Qipengyuania gaetbuli]